MHQPEITVDEIEIQEQALAARGSHERFSFFSPERERAAWLQYRKHTNQSLFDVIAFGNLFGKILFLDLLLKVLIRPSFLYGDVDGMSLYALGVLNKKRLRFPKSNPGIIEELRHLPTAHDRQIPAKQHAIETRKHTVNPILVFFDEFFQGFNPAIATEGS